MDFNQPKPGRDKLRRDTLDVQVWNSKPKIQQVAQPGSLPGLNCPGFMWFITLILMIMVPGLLP